MSSQSSGNAPVLYEDRTLFPTPVRDERRPEPPPPRTGLSAVGVLLVAVFAAAVAGGIVWFASQSMTSPATTAAPSPQLAELRQENERLAGVIKQFEQNQAQARIEGYEDRITELEAQVANFGSYGRLAELEQQISQRKQEIERLIAQPERQRMPANARAIPASENDTTWVARVETELQDYLETLEDRVEWVASWPARNPPPPCADPENC